MFGQCFLPPLAHRQCGVWSADQVGREPLEEILEHRIVCCGPNGGMEFHIGFCPGSVVGLGQGLVPCQQSFEPNHVGDIAGKSGLPGGFLFEQDSDVVDLNDLFRSGLVNLQSACALLEETIMLEAPEGVADRCTGHAKPFAQRHFAQRCCRWQGPGKNFSTELAIDRVPVVASHFWWR